jgi:hypothetical protein
MLPLLAIFSIFFRAPPVTPMPAFAAYAASAAADCRFC